MSQSQTHIRTNAYMHPPLDAQDAKLLAKYTSARNRTPCPRVGDFVIFPDGDKRVIGYTKSGWRRSWDWDKASWKEEQIIDEVTVYSGASPFYLSAKGADNDARKTIGNRTIQLSSLVDTGEMRLGEFKFVHHGGNPWDPYIHVQLPCHVYRAS